MLRRQRALRSHKRILRAVRSFGMRGVLENSAAASSTATATQLEIQTAAAPVPSASYVLLGTTSACRFRNLNQSVCFPIPSPGFRKPANSNARTAANGDNFWKAERKGECVSVHEQCGGFVGDGRIETLRNRDVLRRAHSVRSQKTSGTRRVQFAPILTASAAAAEFAAGGKLLRGGGRYLRRGGRILLPSVCRVKMTYVDV